MCHLGPVDERVRQSRRLGHGCWRVRMQFGFKNRPDVPQALGLCTECRV